MNTTTLNHKVTLRQLRTGQGHGRNTTAAVEAEVFAAVREPGLAFRSSLAASGLAIDRTVILWRSEFAKAAYTHILIDDVLYRIVSVGPGINDRFVSVAVSRDSAGKNIQ